MNIPKYVREILERSEYEYSSLFAKSENYAAGYTISIPKYSYMQTADTFRKDIERFCSWINREYRRRYEDDTQIAVVLCVPVKTKHKYMQYATVTIFDPMMKVLEEYIGQKGKSK